MEKAQTVVLVNISLDGTQTQRLPRPVKTPSLLSFGYTGNWNCGLVSPNGGIGCALTPVNRGMSNTNGSFLELFVFRIYKGNRLGTSTRGT